MTESATSSAPGGAGAGAPDANAGRGRRRLRRFPVGRWVRGGWRRSVGLRGYAGETLQRLRSGELGSLPVVVGLIIIGIVFQSLNNRFLSAENLSDLSVQITSTGLIAVGVVFVLLIGQIDLAVGSVSGLSAAVLANVDVYHGVNEYLAIVIAVVTGVVVGMVHGFFYTRIGVPAFVVTLAGNIGWLGLQLQVLGKNGTINLSLTGPVAKLTSTYFSQIIVAYAVATVVVVVFAVMSLWGRHRYRAAGLPSRSLGEIVVRVVVLAVIAYAVAAMFNHYKGLPLAPMILLAFVVAFDLLLRRTRYGRSVLAVGGNAEAARRAGVRVAFVRASVFTLCSTMAAVGGVMGASYIYSASQQAGTGEVLLDAIAAAVIGGTSLFGGRGSTYSALLGMLVIGAVASGMNLQQLGQPMKFMITGAVLLAAVVVDSVSRRTQKSAGVA